MLRSLSFLIYVTLCVALERSFWKNTTTKFNFEFSIHIRFSLLPSRRSLPGEPKQRESQTNLLSAPVVTSVHNWDGTLLSSPLSPLIPSTYVENVKNKELGRHLFHSRRLPSKWFVSLSTRLESESESEQRFQTRQRCYETAVKNEPSECQCLLQLYLEC